jgi:hypothetical protein
MGWACASTGAAPKLPANAHVNAPNTKAVKASQIPLFTSRTIVSLIPIMAQGVMPSGPLALYTICPIRNPSLFWGNKRDKSRRYQPK